MILCISAEPLVTAMLLLAVPFQALAVESTAEAETGEQAQTAEPAPEEQAEPEEDPSVMSEDTTGGIQAAGVEGEEVPQEQGPHAEEEQAGKTAGEKTSKKKSKTDRQDATDSLITVQPQPVSSTSRTAVLKLSRSPSETVNISDRSASRRTALLANLLLTGVKTCTFSASPEGEQSNIAAAMVTAPL